MPATTGTWSLPRRRRFPSTSVVGGYSEKITSGRTRSTSSSIPRDPSARTSCCVRRRVGPSATQSQNVASQSHRKRKKTTPGARSFRSTKTLPSTCRPSTVTTSTPGHSSRSWSASVRAGKSCPSPTLAVRIRTRVTRSSLDARSACEHGADLLARLRGGERLLDERPLGPGIRVTRGVENTHPRNLTRDAVGELEGVHLRHHDVRDEQVDRDFATHGVDRGIGRRRIEHRVPGALQRQPDDVATGVLIINDENGSGHGSMFAKGHRVRDPRNGLLRPVGAGSYRFPTDGSS